MSELYRELSRRESDSLGLPRREPIGSEPVVWFSNDGGQVFYAWRENVPASERAPLPTQQDAEGQKC